MKLPLDPNSIKDLTPYVEDDPYGVNLVIKSIQLQLQDDLDWLQFAFGRAITRIEKRTLEINQEVEYIYPSAYNRNGKDLVDLMQMDNFDSYCFFTAQDPETFDEYQERVSNSLQRNLSVHFWFNLDQERLNSGGFDITEKLKEDVINSIGKTNWLENQAKGASVEGVDLTAVFDSPENVFNGFTLDLAESQFLYFPYRGFRIDMLSYYTHNCQ